MKWFAVTFLTISFFFPLLSHAKRFGLNVHLDAIANIDVLADQAGAPMRYSGSLSTSYGNYYVTMGEGAQAPDTYYRPTTGAFRFPLSAEVFYTFSFIRLGIGGTYSFEKGQVDTAVKVISGLANNYNDVGTIKGTLSLSQPALNIVFDILLQQTPSAEHHIVYTYSMGYNHLDYTVTSNDSPLQNVQNVSFDYMSTIHRLEDRLYFPNGMIMTAGLWLEDALEDTNEGATQKHYADATNTNQLNNFKLGGSLNFGMYLGLGYCFSIF